MDVFADEAGYSGTQLMNADAPVFVLATCNICPDEARLLIEKFRPAGSNELHFAEQCNEHIGLFIELIRQLKEYSEHIFVNVAHKPYVTLIKAFDFWIDCQHELVGRTIYTDRRMRGLANMAYLGLNIEWGQERLFRFLRSFQDMMNGSDQASYDQFWQMAHGTTWEADTLGADFVAQLCDAEKALGGRVHRDKLRKQGNVMDVVLTMEKQALSYWSAVTPDHVDYFHDEASEFAQQKTIWTALVSDTGEPREFKVGDRVYSFPLKMRTTSFVRSEECYPVQLCDVLASSINLVFKRMFGVTSEPEIAEQFRDAGVLEFVKDGVWPSTDPDDWKVEPGSDVDRALEYTSSRIASTRKPNVAEQSEVMNAMEALRDKDYRNAYIGLKGVAAKANIFSVGPYLILGLMTEAGLFVKPNASEADNWYLKAINEPDRDGRFVLPLLLLQEHGCRVDRFLTLLEKCAEDGNVEAGYKLASLSMQGLPGHAERNLGRALRWAAKTAPHYTPSQTLLACMYQRGIGTPVDLNKAIHWYTAAASSGDAEAIEMLVKLAERAESTQRKRIK